MEALKITIRTRILDPGYNGLRDQITDQMHARFVERVSRPTWDQIGRYLWRGVSLQIKHQIKENKWTTHLI